MKSWLRLSSLCVLAVTSVAAAKLDLDRVTPVPADQSIPTQDFFRPPLFSEPRLNASGTHFAALAESGQDHTGLMICDLEKKKINHINGSTDEDIGWIAWLDDTRILFSSLTEKKYAVGLAVVDVRNPRNNYHIVAFSATELVTVPRKHPMKPLVWIYRNAYDEGKNFGVAELDASTGLIDARHVQAESQEESQAREDTDLYGTRAKILAAYNNPPAGHVPLEFLPNHEDALGYAITLNDGAYTLFRYAGLKCFKSPLALADCYPVTFGEHPDELIAVGRGAHKDAGKPAALYRANAATGQIGELLAQDKEYDFANLSFYRHPETNAILGLRYARSKMHSLWLDPAMGRIQQMLNASFPKQVVSILDSDQAQTRFFVSVYSDREPAVYYLLDLKTNKVGLVKKSRPWIDPARMQGTRILKVPTRNGLEIECYLTLPAGATPETSVPLVVLPHGGPHVRDIWGFDPEVQFLAAHGYAVLQPNYRGSSGYGWKFPGADQWDFQKMHEDVTDAVQAVIGLGLIDKQRVAIMGSSFGGYLALMGAVQEPGLYRCATTIAGVFDWEQMLREKKYGRWEEDAAIWADFIKQVGDPKKDPALFARISPLRQIDRVKIPVFVAHGKEDRVAHVDESKALVAELKKHQVPHEVMLVANEGHGMSYAKNQIELYDRILAFLDQNLKPKR